MINYPPENGGSKAISSIGLRGVLKEIILLFIAKVNFSSFKTG
jgi:hypothetical protein